MKTIRTMPATIRHYSKVKSVELADTTHVVPRSGFKRLGYNEQQRAQLRAIKAEMSQCNH